MLTGLLLSASPLLAGPFTPLPGDGTSEDWCDITSFLDTDGRDHTIEETLRHRIELYNQPASRGGLCFFYMFFTFKDREITISKPLTLEKMLRDRNADPILETVTGTYISGYGTGGIHDKLNITIDAFRLTQDRAKCAFVIKGGFAAKQQIHGLNISVRTSGQAICDEEGHDLLEAASPNCEGHVKGKDCDFSDVTVLAPEATPPANPTTPANPPMPSPSAPPPAATPPTTPAVSPTVTPPSGTSPSTPAAPSASSPATSPSSPASPAAPSASPASPAASPSSGASHDESFGCHLGQAQTGRGHPQTTPSFLMMLGLPLVLTQLRRIKSLKFLLLH